MMATCKFCGKEGVYRLGRCSDCASERMDARRQRRGAASEIKTRLLAERGSTCEECGATGYVEMHHKTRLADGGTNDSNNLQLLCADCHLSKRGTR